MSRLGGTASGGRPLPLCGRKPVFSTHLNTMHPVRLNTACKSKNFLERSSLKFS